MGVVDLIFPRICFGCGEKGGYFCDDCVFRLERRPAICPMCGRHSMDGWVHARCERVQGLDRLISPYRYYGLLQRAIKRVKFSSSWDVLGDLVELLYIELPSFSEEWVVMSVPMYKKKRNARGFDQAGVIAGLLARRLQTPYAQLLKRVRPTKAQYGMDKKERAENVRGVFSLKKAVGAKRIILVDDVWTSGSTMRECCKVLKRGGVEQVWGVALAR